MSKIDLTIYPTFKFAPHIAKICLPLRMLEIDFFRYGRIYNDGSRIILTNKPHAVQFLYCDDNYLQTWFGNENIPTVKKSEKIIWAVQRLTDNNYQNFLQHEIKRYFDLTHGVVYLIQNENFVEIFDFGSSNIRIYSYSDSLFNRFSYYFKEQAKKILKCSIQEKILIPHINHTNKNQIISENEIRSFVDSTPIKRFYLKGQYEGIYLTLKEVECLRWCIIGKTADETARIIGCSTRTVENHLYGIKNKTGCFKQANLIAFAIEQGITHL
jgi:DNA-binding CsgD family transcriptional regulator